MSITRAFPRDPRQRGFSYIEVALSVVLLGVLLVPALESLQSGVAGNQNSSVLARQLNLTDKMERVLARPFADLYAQTYLPGGNTPASVSAALSDPVGTPDRRNVVLYRYDPSSGSPSAGDTGVLLVRVYYESESGKGLNTLASGWW